MWATLKDYASRKFVLAMTSLGSGVYITRTEDEGKVYAFAALLVAILGFYNGANVAEVWANRGTKYSETAGVSRYNNQSPPVAEKPE